MNPNSSRDEAKRAVSDPPPFISKLAIPRSLSMRNNTDKRPFPSVGLFAAHPAHDPTFQDATVMEQRA